MRKFFAFLACLFFLPLITTCGQVAPALAETPRPLFSGLKGSLADTDPFIKDTRLNLHLRTYYFDRHRPGGNPGKAWALGGWIEYRSGWWKDLILLGGALYTSQPLDAPEDKGGTLLLAPGQEAITVPGQAYLKLRPMDELDFTLYRQIIDKPFINRQDSRMIPNTFEAYTFSAGLPAGFKLEGGFAARMKKRNANSFVSMSRAAGAEGDDRGAGFICLEYDSLNWLKARLSDVYALELFNSLYLDAGGKWRLFDGAQLSFDAQYMNQAQVGEERLGELNARQYGVKAGLDWRGFGLAFAYCKVEGDYAMKSPFGSFPGFTSVMVQDFDRAGEGSIMARLSYDFSRLGLKGLSAYALFVNGDTPDSGNAASPDQTEFDLTADYRFDGALKNLWVRVRYAEVDQDEAVGGAQDIRDFRVIVNYEIPLL